MHVKSAAELLEDYIDEDTPAFMWGAPGVGKSSVVHQIVAKRKWGIVDFRASTRDPVALMGLPDISGETTRWKVPDEFPQVERDGEEGILLLDELNAAPPSMMAAMFGFVLERKIGDYVLPPGWRIVAAGNRQSDRAAAQRMPTALANRFAHIFVEPDLSGGHDNVHLEYFVRKNADPIGISFLRFRPALIHRMPKPEEVAFESPRSWEQAFKYINKPSSRRLNLVSGCVGEGAASELEAFIRVYMGLPSLESIIRDPMSAKLVDEPSARFAVCSALARRANDNSDFNAAMTYVLRMQRRDFEIMFAVDTVRGKPPLSNTRTFIDWSVRNSDVIIG